MIVYGIPGPWWLSLGTTTSIGAYIDGYSKVQWVYDIYGYWREPGYHIIYSSIGYWYSCIQVDIPVGSFLCYPDSDSIVYIYRSRMPVHPLDTPFHIDTISYQALTICFPTTIPRDPYYWSIMVVSLWNIYTPVLYQYLMIVSLFIYTIVHRVIDYPGPRRPYPQYTIQIAILQQTHFLIPHYIILYSRDIYSQRSHCRVYPYICPTGCYYNILIYQWPIIPVVSIYSRYTSRY